MERTGVAPLPLVLGMLIALPSIPTLRHALLAMSALSRSPRPGASLGLASLRSTSLRLTPTPLQRLVLDVGVQLLTSQLFPRPHMSSLLQARSSCSLPTVTTPLEVPQAVSP